MTKFDQNQPLALRPDIPFKEISRDTPAHAGDGIMAAIGFSLGAGLVTLFSLGLIVWGLDKPFRIALIGGGIASFVVAVYWFTRGDDLVYSSERITGPDIIIPDGFIGQPTQQPRYFVIDAKKEEGNGFNRYGFPVPENDNVLIEWIDAALHQRSLAIEIWEPLFGYVYPRGIKTPVYTMFRTVADKKGLLINRGSHGIVLSKEGIKEFGGILEELRRPEYPELTEGEVGE